MLELIITKTFEMIQEGTCPVYAGTGIIHNDPVYVGMIGDTGRAAAHLMKEGEKFMVSGHFKDASHLGIRSLFIITDITLSPESAVGKQINFYA
jgi:hypothetical protein